jgi:hypothetical protein
MFGGCSLFSKSAKSSKIYELRQGEPDPACPKNHVKMHFSMAPTLATDKIPQTLLINDPENKELTFIKPDENSNVIIETCMDGDGKLSKILNGSIYRKNLPSFQFGNIDKMYSGTLWNSTIGLSEAIFGDTSQLNAKLPIEEFESSPRVQLVLNGWTLGGKNFITARLASIENDKKNEFTDILVGELVADLPKQENGCSAFEVFEEKSTQYSHGKVDTKMCTVTQNHLDAKIYRALEITIQLPAQNGLPESKIKIDETGMINNKNFVFDGSTVHGSAYGYRLKQGENEVFVLAKHFLINGFPRDLVPNPFPESHLEALIESEEFDPELFVLKSNGAAFSVKRGSQEWTTFELKLVDEEGIIGD